jgi:hypothetical protein
LPAESFCFSSKRKLWDLQSKAETYSTSILLHTAHIISLSLSLSISLSLPLSHTQIKKQEEKRISWIAVILESLTLEIMKEVALQGKARRAIQTSLSNRREALVLLNWKRSDYMAKWVVITIPPFTVLLTLQLSTRRYLSPFPSPPLS